MQVKNKKIKSCAEKRSQREEASRKTRRPISKPRADQMNNKKSAWFHFFLSQGICSVKGAKAPKKDFCKSTFCLTSMFAENFNALGKTHRILVADYLSINETATLELAAVLNALSTVLLQIGCEWWTPGETFACTRQTDLTRCKQVEKPKLTFCHVMHRITSREE